jgi:hypothetical protein
MINRQIITGSMKLFILLYSIVVLLSITLNEKLFLSNNTEIGIYNILSFGFVFSFIYTLSQMSKYVDCEKEIEGIDKNKLMLYLKNSRYNVIKKTDTIIICTTSKIHKFLTGDVQMKIVVKDKKIKINGPKNIINKIEKNI